MSPELRARWERETRRIYSRYQREFVEGHTICPWAERARNTGSVRVRVDLSAELDPDQAAGQCREIAEDKNVEIGLLIFPRASLDRRGFERFASTVRRLLPPREFPMAIAAFHPAAPPPDAETIRRQPAQLVPFLRRSPDPTLQLVHESALARVRRGEKHGTGFIDPELLGSMDLALQLQDEGPPLHERVAARNAEAVLEVGVNAFETLFEDIRRDRDESYRKLGEL
ncbi:MAG: DUF1415 family protein [Myxococcota bacterium]